MTTNLYQDSLELSRSARSVLEVVTRRDQALGRRLKRACERSVEHLEEAMCHVGRSRARDYQAAGAAAREAMACVQAAEVSGYLPEGDGGLRGRLGALSDGLSRGKLTKAA